MIETLTDIVLNITGFLLVLLASVVIIRKEGNKYNRAFILAFLLSKAFLIVRWCLFRYELLSFAENYVFYYLSCSFFFLLAPFVFLYIKSLCYRNFSFVSNQYLHFIPFILIIITLIFSLNIQNRDSVIETFILYKLLGVNIWKIFWGFNLVQILGYIIAIFNTIYNYRTKLKEQYSSIQDMNLSWLFSLLLLISLHWIFVTSKAVFSLINSEYGILFKSIDLFSITIFLVFATCLVLRGLYHSTLFHGIEQKSINGIQIGETEMNHYADQLKNFMELQKPYLTPAFSINDLSEQLSIPSWQLSHVINRHFNQNFFNFINSFRIEEFKQHLLDPANSKKTILEILYDVGFNSKSTFNDVFKKHTGMTPTEFKKMHQN